VLLCGGFFGGISVVWIGDVHQLPPVFGHAVFSASKKMTNSDVMDSSCGQERIGSRERVWL
jgi:hypothetical protein